MAQHPVENFWSTLQGFTAYPPDVTPVPGLLPGTAAFAASAGLYRPAGSHDLPPFPYGGLMIIGHNLDSLVGYERRWRSGTSHGDVVPGAQPMSTWRGLYKLLDGAGVDRHQFFFTNVFVGLKHGTPTGLFTSHDAPAFKRWCREFLGYQVTTMRPRVVVVLGRPACRDIAEVAVPAPWRAGPLPPPVAVAARLWGHETILVPAHHTSMQKRLGPDTDALRVSWRDVNP